MNDSGYLVSIRCLTFNHASYITDAMDGFCIQQTTFPFVALIVDDNSTDGEQEVIRNYLDCHFEMSFAQNWETEDAVFIEADHNENKSCHFVVVLLKKNLYRNKPKKVSLIARWEDNVKYRAGCEGDDYWTDSLKLQKQVGFLESHPDFSMCTHASLWETDGELYKEGCQHGEECALSSDEVIRYGGLYLATASLVFRKELADDWPKWRKLSDVGDYPLQILGTLRGGMYFFPDLMCVYRFQHPGSWTSRDKLINYDHLLCEVNWMTQLDIETQHKYHNSIYIHLFPRFWRVLYRGNKISTKEYIKAYIDAGKPISKYRLFKDIVRYIVKNDYICKNF